MKILLENLENKLKEDGYEVIVVNDFSTEKQNIFSKKFQKIKNIKILNLSQNVGSQGCISIGLKFLSNLNKNCLITIMDGDGEDDPGHVNNLFDFAEKYPNLIITSNRLNRHDGKLFQFFYKIHLMITFLLTFKWINFGNFSCFNSQILSQLQSNNQIGVAVSAAISKNCKIYKCPSKRLKRYKDNSKVSYFGLILHSLRILSVFYNRIILSSLMYGILFLLVYNVNTFATYGLMLLIFIFNILLVLINKKYKITSDKFNKILLKKENQN